MYDAIDSSVTKGGWVGSIVGNKDGAFMGAGERRTEGAVDGTRRVSAEGTILGPAEGVAAADGIGGKGIVGENVGDLVGGEGKID